MQQLYRNILSWGRTALQSLAFLPLPMMFASFFAGAALFYLELNTDISRKITDLLPSAILSSQETARSVLTLIIGGLITLTVFTFTQMMTLFSQVANSYSPRLLPYFTGSRSLQFVMGTYLAVIILSIIVLLSIRGDDEGYIPNLSVLLCLLLGVGCLMLFLYFVTTISNKIQVSNIIEEVYRKGINAIDGAHDKAGFAERSLPEGLADWYAIPSPIGGYIGVVNYHQLSMLATKHDTSFYIGTARGMFVPRNYPLIQSRHKLDQEAVKEALQAVSPIRQKFTDWRLPPVRLLTEIAVKAMSPGINDPGTAIDVMDRLTGLLLRLMYLPEYNFYQAEDEDGGDVWLAGHHFSDVLATVMQQLRQYCKSDTTVVRRLFQMLFHLLGAAGDSLAHQKAIRRELRALLDDARDHILNSADRKVIASEIKAHRAMLKQLLEDTDFLLDPHLEEPGINP
ncbi:DUF2254 domain-containing protein [Neolewinella aurantiaca]|uniref:DUF2254 domain-containing protein n=1 Tax=Neolewinella aurantiaca TaxID=2602767 RepID=A0A5C7FHB6_9BACT|nr:DUF2254 domain-containing protein [Neolewinella aurantiaca]TXF89826.1 DUF2254 domain-containing protein [Neolewinella aurantiaca]